ncbi:hypothetical protein HLA99_12655, partial [Microbacterium ulmi]|nr:hypothetical protein [Microbacterium ulmi]
MDAATRAELDALRARAYGPAADIQADPGAIARLELLERIVHGAASASAGRSPPGTRAGDGNDPWAGEPATRPLDGGIGDASGDGVGVARDPGYPRDPGDPRDPGYPRDPGDPRDPGYQRDAGDEGVEPARRRRTGRT